MRRLLHGLLGATLLLGACGGDDGGDRSAVTSIPDETSSTSSTTTEPRTVAPDVIPQDESLITEQYVEQVLDALYEVSLEAVEHTRSAGVVDEVTIELIESINSERQARDALNSLMEAASRGFAEFRDDLSPATADVSSVIHGDSECVFAEVRFDSSGLLTELPPVPSNGRTFARLVAASEEQRSSGHNPTAWVIDGLPATDDGTVPSESCPAP